MHQPQPQDAVLSQQLHDIAEDNTLPDNPQLPQSTLTQAADSVSSTLVRSELIQLPLQQNRPHSQPPTQHALVQSHTQFVLNASQHQNQQVQPGQYRQQQVVVVQPQYQPQWVNQPQTTQARLQDQRSRTLFFSNQMQPQVVPSHRIFQSTHHNQNLARGPVPRPQERLAGVSPPKINFNYSFSSSQVSPPSQPMQTVPPQQFILPSGGANQVNAIVVWEQRYFLIIERFEFYYTRFDTITQQYVFIQQAIERANSIEELSALREQSRELLHTITETQQELTETVHQNKALLGEAVNWKQKYDQLVLKFNELAHSQQQTSKIELNSKYEQLQKRFSELNKENQQAAVALKEWRGRYEQLQIENSQYKEQISQIDRITEHIGLSQNQIRQQSIIINSRDEEIANLRKVIAALQNSSHSNTDLHQLSAELTQNQKIIASLRQENDSLYLRIQKNKEEQEELAHKNTEVLTVFEQQIQQLNHQIESYRSTLEQKVKMIDSLSRMVNSPVPAPVQSPPSINQSVSLQNQSELRRLRHQLRVKEDTHQSDMKISNGKIEELVDKLRMLGNEKNAIVASLQEKVNLLDSDLTRKDGTIRNLRDRILELEQEKRIKELDNKYSVKKTAEASLIEGSTQLNSIKRQLNEKINEIEELQAQITEYKRITNEYEDSLSVKKHEINNLKRLIDGSTNIAEDVTKLNELLNRRNAEIIDLKNRSFELQKIGNQNELLRQENLSLNEALKRKHSEIVEMNDKIYLFEKKVRELEVDRDKSPTVVHLNEENELLENANKKKDQEIAKLRQSNQLLETNVEELESELQKLRSKVNSGERLSENEKNDLRIKLTNYQSKFAEFERKVIGLQEVRSILQEQVTTLTTEIHIKIESAQKAQLELKQERVKVKAFEAETESLLTQNEEFRLKMKELDRKYQSLQKEIQAEAEKKKELTNTKKSELFSLNNKCMELENTIKNKDSKIKELEKSIETLNYKIRNMDHNLEEIEYLKHKITEYQTKISNMGYQKHQNYRISDIEHTQVFEKKVIYQLKVQNQALKKQLGYNQIKNPSRPTSQSDIPERDGKQQHVQQRLNDFNQKLQSVISDQHATIQFPNLNHDELYKQYERDRRQLIERHNEEISQLKVKILQLQRQSSQGMIEIKGKKTYANVDSVYNEQLQFYRDKNQELEERVDNHIRVNKELKDSIELLMRGHNEEYSIHYYKEQLEKSSEVIATLQAKLKKLNEEHKRLKEENVRSQSKLITDNNTFESESRITDLTRKINQLTVQISLNEKEKISRTQLLEESQKQIKKLRIQMDEFKLWKEETIRNYKEKQANYQDEIAKLNNKYRINLSQIERLNDIINKKQGQQSGDLKTLKIKLVELQEENKKYKSKLEELIINEEKYQREVSKLENQTKLLQGEIQRLKELTDSSSRKIKEYENELQSTKILITEYESKLRLYDSNTDAWSYKQSQYQQEITKYSNQIKLLQSEIDRVNEFSQKKLSEKDGEINRWKLVINERNEQISIMEQHINELKVISYRSNESAQQIFNLKQEINRLKIALNAKSNESESRLYQISELHHSLEVLDEQLKEVKRTSDSKVYDLNSTIGYLEDQSKESKKSYEVRISQLNINIQTLEDQMNELNKSSSGRVYQLNSTIYKLEQQLREANDSNQNLNSHVQYLKLQVENINEEAGKEITHLRSVIDQLNQQLRESGSNNDSTIYELNQTIYKLNQELRELKNSADSKVYELNITIKQLEDHLKQVSFVRDEEANQLKGYIAHLQQEINELKRSKDGRFAETDLIIQQLEQKIRVLQVSTMQSKVSIRQLEESNFQLAASNRQLQSSCRQLQDIKRQLEKENRELQATSKQMEQSIIQLELFNKQSETSRQQVEFSYRQLSKSYKQLQLSYEKIELQIRQLCQVKDNQIQELRERILYLESHMKEWAVSHEYEINQLRTIIQKLEIQLHEVSVHSETQILELIRNSKYTIEFMRSSLIEVDVLLTEDTIPRQYLARRISQEIDKALQECSRWNETL